MNQDSVFLALSKPLGKQDVLALSTRLAVDFDVQQLIRLTFNANAQVAFRAAWILENIYFINPLGFLPYMDSFLANLTKQQNHSVQRHFVKILAHMGTNKAPIAVQDKLNSTAIAALVETIFAWLIDEKIPVAVKSHCLSILANFCSRKSWIKDELIATMNYLVDHESIAFFAKAKQIKKQLAKQ